jgi:hypothetical protein
MATAARTTPPPEARPLSQLSPRELARFGRELKAEHVRRRFERDPEAAARRARRAVLETDRRYARAKRAEQGAREPFDTRMARLRSRDLETLFAFRWGNVLPDDDAGIGDAIILAHHVRNLRGDLRRNILASLMRWAPWLTPERANDIATEAIERPRRWRAPTLGWRMQLTEADRAMLGITTIRAINCTDEQQAENRRAKSRQRTEAGRRAEGAVPRAAYLAANSLSRQKPWEAEGICRRTWERRRKANETNVAGARVASPYAPYLASSAGPELATPAAPDLSQAAEIRHEGEMSAPSSAALGRSGAGNLEGGRRPIDTARKKASSSAGISGTSPHHGVNQGRPAQKVRLAARDHASDHGHASPAERLAISAFKARRAKTMADIERGKRATESMLVPALTRAELEAEEEARRRVVLAREDARNKSAERADACIRRLDARRAMRRRLAAEGRAPADIEREVDAEHRIEPDRLDAKAESNAKVERLEAEHQEVVRKNRMAASARIVEQRRARKLEDERCRRAKFERYAPGTYVGDMLRREEAQRAESERVRSLSVKQREAERRASIAKGMGITVEELAAVDAARRATDARGGTWSRVQFDATVAQLRSGA